jgi:hypothetical protein
MIVVLKINILINSIFMCFGEVSGRFVDIL